MEECTRTFNAAEIETGFVVSLVQEIADHKTPVWNVVNGAALLNIDRTRTPL